jgi:hypothetical protein
MTSEDTKPILSYELFKAQINELKTTKADLEKMKNELTEAQTKYHQHLSEYETKLEQLCLQTDKIQQEQEEKETNLLNATKEWLEIKTKLNSSVISPNQKVKLNVGGEHFDTTMETLTKYSEGTTSYFKVLFSRQWELEKDPKDERIFIDRDGYLFGHVLQYLRTGKIAIDSDNSLLRRDLIIEAQFYIIDSLVDLLNTNQPKRENIMQSNPLSDSKKLYSNTTILAFKDQVEVNKLGGFNDQQWQLIYKASRDGYTAKAFHQYCDSCFPTMCVIRSKNGFIFGGFTTVAWGSIKGDKTDASAFLFTLKNPHDIKPTKYPILERGVRFAVSHNPNEGPTFGSTRYGGVDLFLQSPFNVQGCRTFFPHSYQDTTKKDRFTFTGDPYFSCDEIEIFTLV